MFSTLSFTVGLHYCGNHLVDIAINDEARGCGMDLSMNITSGEDGERCIPAPMPCCQDVQVTFDGNEDLQPAFDTSAPQPLYLQVAIIPYPLSVNRDLNRPGIAHQEYLPPPLIRNFPILHQVFLI
jgi:hypothetical protein